MARLTAIDKAIAELDRDIVNLTKAREILVDVKGRSERKVRRTKKVRVVVTP